MDKKLVNYIIHLDAIMPTTNMEGSFFKTLDPYIYLSTVTDVKCIFPAIRKIEGLSTVRIFNLERTIIKGISGMWHT